MNLRTSVAKFEMFDPKKRFSEEYNLILELQQKSQSSRAEGSVR